jgi:hypothetical protein
MDILSDGKTLTENRSDSSPTVLQKIPGIFRWLTDLFVLNDDELSESGIMMGSDSYEGSSYLIEKMDHADTVL